MDIGDLNTIIIYYIIFLYYTYTIHLYISDDIRVPSHTRRIVEKISGKKKKVFENKIFFIQFESLVRSYYYYCYVSECETYVDA